MEITEGFSWENRFQQSWELLKEDEAGQLMDENLYAAHRMALNSEYLKKRRMAADVALRRSIMRHVILVVDWSLAAASTDASPNRAAWMVKYALEPFIKEFIEQNPLSQLGLVLLRDGVAEILTALSSTGLEHIETLNRTLNDINKSPLGFLSLQNGLNVAKSMLLHVPGHASREILVIQIGLSTLDPGDLIGIIPDLIKDKVRINFVSLHSEVAVCKRIAQKTGGSFQVAIDDIHFIDLVNEHIRPPTSISVKGHGRLGSYAIRMGFPEAIVMSIETAGPLCACHGEPRGKGFICPQCKAYVCQAPIDCPVCKLTLTLAPHLSKSYHYLFPPPAYIEKDATYNIPLGGLECMGCGEKINDGESCGSSIEKAYKAGYCKSCKLPYCSHCNEFIHERLFNCPTCAP